MSFSFHLTEPLLAVDAAVTPGAATHAAGRVAYHAAPLTDLDPHFFAKWLELESAAVEPSVFLSRRFLSPASRLLLGHPSPLIVWGESEGGEVVSLGAFEEVLGTPRMPCRHLRGWRCLHTYADGMLVRGGWEAAAWPAFWEFAAKQGWPALELAGVPVEASWLARFDQSADDVEVTISRGASWSRAICLPALAARLPGEQCMSDRRAKSLRRGWKQLEKHGTPQFVLRCSRNLADSTRMLLFLEALGWKGEAATAMASSDVNRNFFATLVEEFAAAGDSLFLELTIDERVVGSVLVLRSGSVGCTFKLGWDPQLERGCPGFHLLSRLQSAELPELAGLQLIDSCSSPGSFIERVWPARRRLGSRLYAISRRARVLTSLRDGVRRARSLWTGGEGDMPAETRRSEGPPGQGV